MADKIDTSTAAVEQRAKSHDHFAETGLVMSSCGHKRAAALFRALAAERDAADAELADLEKRNAQLQRDFSQLFAQTEAAEVAWQPIETAPKDCLIDIWLFDGVRWCDCYHDRITDTWRTSRPSGRLLSIGSGFVTHWMHRPDPPADLAKGGDA